MARSELTDEMLEAFLALELQDAHVQSRREVLSAKEAETVARSVAARRRMSGATGVPEGEDEARPFHLGNRMVPDPHMSDSEFYHQRAQNPTKPNIGRVYAQENSLTRIGALCFIRKRLNHHELAAEQFKNLYEARYGSGNPAMDASRVQVDTSPVAHDSGMAGKIDRTWKLEKLETQLGKDAFNRIVACVVLCIPCGEGEHWRARAKNVDALLDALDRAAEILRLKAKAA